MNLDSVVCLYPSYSRRHPFQHAALVEVGAGVSVSRQEPVLDVWVFNEEHYKLRENYKITFDSLNPYVTPSRTMYLSDFKSSLKTMVNEGQWPLAGFYTKMLLESDDEVNKGDVHLIHADNKECSRAEVLVVDDIRTNFITRTLMGKFGVTGVVPQYPKQGTKFINNSFVQLNDTNVGKAKVYRLHRVFYEEVIKIKE